jgi:hypothetical protein
LTFPWPLHSPVYSNCRPVVSLAWPNAYALSQVLVAFAVLEGVRVVVVVKP